MGEIVAFPILAKPIRRRPAASAEILFFTGVRYAREADALPTTAPTQSDSGAPDRTSPSRRRKRRA
jgi:hypothetical protein